MSSRAGSQRHPTKLIAFENGSKFSVADGWRFHTTNSAGWLTPPTLSSYQNSAMGFNNNSGTGIGLALYRHDASVFSLADAGGYDDAHSVHLRVTHGNQVGTDVYCLAAATACHDSPAVNGYAVGLTHDGVPRVTLAKIASGVPSVLLSIQREVVAGDVVSISYRWDSGSSIAELAMMVNGTPLEFMAGDFTHLDAGGYEIDAVSNGTFGLFGNSTRSIATGPIAPEVAYEWWVTAGWVSYDEPPPLSQTTSGLRLLIMGRQQFSTDPIPKIRKLVSGAILDCTWSHQRIGGNKDLSARFKLPEVSGLEHVDSQSFSDPTYDDWNTSDWLGGEVVLEYHYQDITLDENQSAFVDFVTDPVWRGRLGKLDVDDQGVVSVRAEGLVGDLDNLFQSRTFENETIRNVIKVIMQNVSKGASVGGFDTYIRYDELKILGEQTVMDVRIDVDFQWESARSAIQRVFEFLPGDMVWGVDRFGDFYVSQEVDYYTEDQTGGTGLQHFEVNDDAVKFNRTTDFKRIRSSYAVLGDEIDDPEPNHQRVIGSVVCDRSRQLFGLRGAVQQESNISDSGTAAKLAAVRLKGLTTPLITGRLTVSRPVREERELWQSLVLGAPRVAITDRRSKVNLSAPTNEMGIDDHITTEYTLRRYGDSTAYACNEKGSAGGNILLASVAKEQNLNVDWLFHIAVSNVFLHPGTSGDSCFLFGRPSSSASDEGWGSLWWAHDGGSNGHLEWRYETSTSTSRVIDTGITLDTDGLGNKTVYFTMWRDASGVFHSYDGNTETDTESGFTSDILQNSTHSWRAFQHGNGSLPATQIDGDAALDQMWLIQTTLVKNQDGGVAGGTGLIADANGGFLPRARSQGLIRYLPLQEPAGAATRTVSSWLDDGLNPPAKSDGVWTRSEASGTGNGVKLSNGARGVLVGKSKKWGGPMIFAAESVKYLIDGSTGVLTREYVLNELPPDLMTNLAVINQEVRRLNESLRRVV